MAAGETFGEAVGSAVKGAVCSFLSADDRLNNWLADKTGGLYGNPGFTGGLRQALCSNPNPVNPDANLPFTGGQCPGVNYRLTITRTGQRRRCSNDSLVADINATNDQFLVGPVSLQSTDTEFNACGGEKQSLLRKTWGGFTSGGSPATTASSLSSLAGEYLDSPQISVVITRQDGQPDTCGNPPPQFDPPDNPDGSWNIGPINVEYTDNSGNTVNQNFNLNLFAPIIGSFNRLSIPVKIGSPQIEVSGQLNLGFNPEFNFTFPRPPGSGETVDTPPPLPPTQIAPPEPEPTDPTRRIVGCIVTVTGLNTLSPATEVLQGDNPNLYVPRLGNVAFLIPVANGISGWGNEIPVKNTRCYVQCEPRQGAIAVRGTPAPGVEWNITPVWGERQDVFVSTE